MVEVDPCVLWWNCRSAHWQEVSWDAWKAFTVGGILGGRGERSLLGIPAGDQRFAVCIIDQHGAVNNVILHRYIVGAAGQLVSGVDGLSDDEQRELSRLEIALMPSDEDEARLAEIRGKWSRQLALPNEAAKALMREMPGPPAEDRECGVWQFLARAGVPHSSRSKH